MELTKRHFADLGIEVKVSWSFGATEAKVPEIVDAIVDVTETGSTLRAHGMKIIATLLDVRPRAGREPRGGGRPDEARGDGDLVTLLQGALAAEGRVLIKLNVDPERARRASSRCALDEGAHRVPLPTAATRSRRSSRSAA